ncbi:YlxR family protein [Arthrobacter gengyunqii]|uniref:YlxR family protein n=1 Tax=Arthrobacter gengyunqii TaxID=2886940 RepID=A0A9X1S5U4_9MICC|nr:YlxR family protein [Arthrobacter gengyunqii]MCC3266421.1 YlxR family protein [Arthrobacter gengyunqii]MCC3269800.1 YlxR family protein [Arthrobacter gengyunqii]
MDEAGSPSAFFLSPAASGAAAHVPIRTCIGCRKTDDQAVLMRLAAVGTDGRIAIRVDERRRMSGRGAWVHRGTACFAAALRRHAFHRAFRGPVETADAEAWFKALEDAPTGSGLETVQPESGSEI